MNDKTKRNEMQKESQTCYVIYISVSLKNEKKRKKRNKTVSLKKRKKLKKTK